MKKTYPKFSDFLAGELRADPTTISNVVRFCREFSQKKKPKRGRGSAEVTPVFAARVLLALAGGGAVPGRAAAMLNQLIALEPKAARPDDVMKKLFAEFPENLEAAKKRDQEEAARLPDLDGLPPGWCEGYLDDVLSQLIEARMKDENFDPFIMVDVARIIIPGAEMVLFSKGSEFRCRFEHQTPYTKELDGGRSAKELKGKREPGAGPRMEFGFGITETARLQPSAWQAVADWLAGRETE